MDENPYRSPNRSPARRCDGEVEREPRYRALVAEARRADARSARRIIFALFIGDAFVLGWAMTCWLYAADWNRETGEPYAVEGVILGIIGTCISALTVLLAVRWWSSLTSFARACALGTLVVLLAAIIVFGWAP